MDVKNEFTANGKLYVVSKTLSIARFKEYEKLVPLLTFGQGFEEIFAGLKKAFSLLNNPAPKPLDAGIIIHNLMNGIKDINDNKRIHPALKMAALVINRKDEDPTKINDQLMLDKISDWEAEGLDMLTFFELSLNSIQGFNEELIKLTQESKKEEQSQS